MGRKMLTLIGMGMFVVGLLGVLVSLILMFVWRVPDLIDEISGRKAKRQIKRLREINQGLSGMSSLSSSDVNDVINNSGTLVWNNPDIKGFDEEEVAGTGNTEDAMTGFVEEKHEVKILEELSSVEFAREENVL